MLALSNRYYFQCHPGPESTAGGNNEKELLTAETGFHLARIKVLPKMKVIVAKQSSILNALSFY